MYRCLLIFLLVVSAPVLRAQDGASKKELMMMLSKPQADTTLIDIYNELAWPVYSYDNADSSLYYAEKAIALATKINDVKRLSIAHRRMGITYINTGDIKTAIRHQEISYELSEKINYTKGMQLALNNIGVAYLNNELVNKALGYFLKSLKIVEKTGNFSSVASLYFNCAIIYRKTGDHARSKDYFFKARHYAQLKHDSDLILSSNSSLSTQYRNLDMLDSSRFYLNEAKNYFTEQTSTSTKFNYYLNEGLLYSKLGDHQKALEAFINTKPYGTITNDQVVLLINIGDEYARLNNTNEALKHYQQAYDISKKNKMYSNLSYLSHVIAGIYQSRKDYPSYAGMIELHLNYRDSNDKYIRVQQVQQQQLEFDYERKQIADSLRFEHKENLKNIELEVAAAKLTKEKYFRIMLVGILVAILIFSVFIFNRFLLTRRQKKIIERQKQIVELKNQEILDSINYAKRLQTAILPQISDIKRELNLDILYLPKDIIGGDFYFFEKYGDHTFFAVCDCTGHGIPGALMSVVCHHALQKSIKEFGLTDPGMILTKARQIVIESLNATQQNIKDGMDCSLLVMNNLSKKVYWAGANNHVWILDNALLPEQTRDTQGSEAPQLVEVKADKQPVAFYENAREFTTHELDIKAGATVYLFTDGYGDQFGGPKGKKYKNKSLKEFLTSIVHEPAASQVTLLQKNFLSWKNDLDQVDDVAVTVIKF